MGPEAAVRKEHDVAVSTTTTSSPGLAHDAPPARRATRPSWRDPRLAVGVALVAGCVLLGARVLASADDTVAVWALRHDVAAGATLGAADLERVDVRFPSGRVADHYVSADAALPAGAVAGRSLTAGEMLPRGALAAEQDASLVEVPLAVAAEAVPVTVREGSVVDVWVTGAAGPSEASEPAAQVFDDVVVVSVPASSTTLGPSTTRQVIVGLEQQDADQLGAALARIGGGDVTLTRQG